jgi:hypothetical protein
MIHKALGLLLTLTFVLGAQNDCQTDRVNLECIASAAGLYGQVSQAGAAVYSWYGPCAERYATAQVALVHEVDPISDTVFARLDLAGPDLLVSATAQARFDVEKDCDYRIESIRHRVDGEVAEHEQGVAIRVFCPSFDDSEDRAWWLDERGWYVGEPVFTAPATETCEVQVREICQSVGAAGGRCLVRMSVRKPMGLNGGCL